MYSPIEKRTFLQKKSLILQKKCAFLQKKAILGGTWQEIAGKGQEGFRAQESRLTFTRFFVRAHAKHSPELRQKLGKTNSWEYLSSPKPSPAPRFRLEKRNPGKYVRWCARKLGILDASKFASEPSRKHPSCDVIFSGQNCPQNAKKYHIS